MKFAFNWIAAIFFIHEYIKLPLFQVVFSLAITATTAAPGYGFEPSFYSPPILKEAPIFTAPTIIKTPIYSPPIIKTPIYAPPPIYTPPPTIIKTVSPIVKTIPPATSYATFTQYVTHPVVVKVILKLFFLQLHYLFLILLCKYFQSIASCN